MAASMSIREWERHGIRRPDGHPFPRPDDHAFLLVPAGVQGPGFLMLANFSVIMKYNPAEAYALAIGHLADRLRGGARLRRIGRDMSVYCRGRSGWNFSNCLRGTVLMSASPMVSLGLRPVLQFANFRPEAAGFRTVLPQPASWTSCARVKDSGPVTTFELTFFRR